MSSSFLSLAASHPQDPRGEKRKSLEEGEDKEGDKNAEDKKKKKARHFYGPADLRVGETVISPPARGQRLRSYLTSRKLRWVTSCISIIYVVMHYHNLCVERIYSRLSLLRY